jgi:magnesium chelatase subunit I
MRLVFPFSAIVGQADMKLALLLAAVDRTLGGVMVFGDRGSGKTTAVRGLAALLPALPVIQGCRFNCEPDAPSSACVGVCRHEGPGQMPAPVVDLPLGATEDRVVGSLDLEKALKGCRSAIPPGSSWSGRATRRRENFDPSCWTASACRSRSARPRPWPNVSRW